MTREQAERYRKFRSPETPPIERLEAMVRLQRDGFVLELPEVVDALSAAINEVKR